MPIKWKKQRLLGLLPFLSIKKALRVQSSWLANEDELDEYSYYVCDMKECHEIFITYEEQLAHRLDHIDFLCVHCSEFCPYGMKHHIRQCQERDDNDNDDEKLEDDNRIQDKPKIQVEETDMDIKGEAKTQRKTSGLSKNKQKGK